MPAANDMSLLLNKIERRLGLILLTPHLTKEYNKEAWADIIMTDTMVTFSRFLPLRVRFVVNEETCIKTRENRKLTWYIREEFLGGAKVLGVTDIDWQDTSIDNMSLGQTAGYGYYVPNYGGLEDTFTAYLGYQTAADVASLYNNNIYIDFVYPNKIICSRAGNLDLNLTNFVVNLLVEHSSLATISPTKMETFESLAMCDIARFLKENLKYFDNLETIFVNIDLKISELDQYASNRDQIIDQLKDANVSYSNDYMPMIMTVSG